jgi:hypothetical protein
MNVTVSTTTRAIRMTVPPRGARPLAFVVWLIMRRVWAPSRGPGIRWKAISGVLSTCQPPAGSVVSLASAEPKKDGGNITRLSLIEGWEWDPTLYGGSAPYYLKGRLPYTSHFAQALVDALAWTGRVD